MKVLIMNGNLNNLNNFNNFNNNNIIKNISCNKIHKIFL
jgi:hypothetical protein